MFPQWGWIVIFSVAVPLIILIVVTILRRGGSIGLGNHTITIPAGETTVIHSENRANESPMGRALHYVPDNIGLVSDFVYGQYLRLVKVSGQVGAEHLTEIEDSQYARLLIKIATGQGNGSHSAQKIIESHIVRRDFLRQGIERYVKEHVVRQVVHTLQEAINSDYDTTIHNSDGSTSVRVVSQVEFVDLLLTHEFQESLAKVIVPFFVYATDCLNGGPKL